MIKLPKIRSRFNVERQYIWINQEHLVTFEQTPIGLLLHLTDREPVTVDVSVENLLKEIEQYRNPVYTIHEAKS